MSTKLVSAAVALATILGLTAIAAASPSLKVTPKKVNPGDPVLVTVTGTKDEPTGKAGGTALHFFKAKGGYQAVFAVPIDAKAAPIPIVVDHAPIAAAVQVADHTFPEADVVVEDELANPDKADRDRIDADNQAIIEGAKQTDSIRFTRPFKRPPGGVSSVFGVWRTFNDGHRSQHLGTDFFAEEGTPVRAINSGTVVLVRETLLAGNVVVISHGAGISSAYYHLSKTSVAEGATVERGDEIGRAGHTGRTTGAHLHLSVRVPGGFVDPLAFLKLPLAPARP